MKILGIKTSPSVIRYAIVNWASGAAVIENVDDNKLPFPKAHTRIEQKLNWLEDELEGLLRTHPDIERIAIKVNEFGRGESDAAREAAYFDAMALLVAGRNGKPVSRYHYVSLATNTAGVMAKAEAEAGRTKVNWDVPMASAIVAAIKAKP